MRAPAGFARLVLASATATASGAACVDEPALGEISSASTVADYQSSGCSTAVVLGLSRQIADEMHCAMPNALVPFDSTPSIVFTNSAVLPYLEESAQLDLVSVASTHTLQINSAFRTIAGQYLLYQWYLQGRCGIAAAATVGSSNHETGRALDLANADAVIAAMAADGWDHDVPGDAVHFDHLTSGDLRGEDTRAFQELWNRNHPEDTIGEDGLYGPETEARLKQAPATGFALGASCAAPPPVTAAEVRAIDGLDRAPPNTRVHFAVTVANTGTTTIPAATRVVIASGTSSPLHDATWSSQTIVTTVGSPIAPGALAPLSFDVMTPNVTAETPVSQRFTFDDGGAKFGTIDVALTVVPGADPGQPGSGEGSEPPTGWTPPDETGGCSTTNDRAGLGLVAGLLVLASRRRRRSPS